MEKNFFVPFVWILEIFWFYIGYFYFQNFNYQAKYVFATGNSHTYARARIAREVGDSYRKQICIEDFSKNF